MIVAAMQPYLFPYLPYYQLAQAVDAFWVLDDVQYIRRGWMNRNRILLNGQAHPVTFPVAKGQRGDLIAAKQLAAEFDEGLNKLFETLSHAYAQAPFKQEMLGLLQGLAGLQSFLDLALQTLQRSFAAMGITTPLHCASTLSLPQTLRGQDRILALNKAVGATTYINPVGGRTLYDPAAFAAQGIALRFIEGDMPPYPQIGAAPFVPGLSILDLIAQAAPAARASQIRAYSVSE